MGSELLEWGSILKLVGGIVAIVVGFFFGYYVIIHPIEQDEDINKDNWRGIIGSIMAIVLGISLLFGVLR
jgi:amino acid transporter